MSKKFKQIVDSFNYIGHENNEMGASGYEYTKKILRSFSFYL